MGSNGQEYGASDRGREGASSDWLAEQRARQDVGRERRSWWEESVHGWDAFGAEARLEIMHACDEVTREVTLRLTGWGHVSLRARVCEWVV